jgi:hypothetical protein
VLTLRSKVVLFDIAADWVCCQSLQHRFDGPLLFIYHAFGKAESLLLTAAWKFQWTGIDASDCCLHTQALVYCDKAATPQVSLRPVWVGFHAAKTQCALACRAEDEEKSIN